jgi:hypothetical protein
MDESTANKYIKELFHEGVLDLSSFSGMCLCNPTKEEIIELFTVQEDYFAEYRQ